MTFIIDTLKKIKNSPLRLFLAPFYLMIIGIELAIERVLDCIYYHKIPRDNHSLDDVTVLIKTFERPIKLKRLIKSIRRRYPDLKIIIVDDSKKPSLFDGIQTIPLPFDSGVSTGRNNGLRAVKTNYVLLLDDDFIVNRQTNLTKAYQNILNNPTIDLFAGEVVNLPFRMTYNYLNYFFAIDHIKPLHEHGSKINGFDVLLKTPNFYIAKTQKLKQVGWNESLKRLDHEDFFYRSIGILTCVQDKTFRVLHDPTYFRKKYLKFRNDFLDDIKIINEPSE